MKRVCVVGAGPAGLAAAVFAARAGAGVAVLERNGHCGAKLLATGGGRANIGNLRPPGEWPALFGKHGRFILPAMEFLPLPALRAWLARLGQPLEAVDGFHLFPASNSARQVRDALVDEATGLGVDIRRGARVDACVPDAPGRWRVHAGGEALVCDAVVFATGGKSYPGTGSTWDGCRIAEGLGHRVRPAYPGLVGLRVANLDQELAGLVLEDAEVLFKVKGRGALRGEGELLLTHGGISGPAVLDISASVAEALAADGEARVEIRWRKGMDREVWTHTIAGWRRDSGRTLLVTLLREFLPLRLARWLALRSGIEGQVPVAQLRSDARDRLLTHLGAFPAVVADTEGWDKAMVTRGGVDTRDIHSATLQSRVAPGLFFAGETLDVDGPCGGYNLHWAFASGALAGKRAASK